MTSDAPVLDLTLAVWLLVLSLLASRSRDPEERALGLALFGVGLITGASLLPAAPRWWVGWFGLTCTTTALAWFLYTMVKVRRARAALRNTGPSRNVET